MRRPARRSVTGPLAVTALLIVALAWGPMAMRSHGAATQDGPAVLAMLFDPDVAVRTSAGESVTATLASITGTLGTAAGIADGRGRAVLTLRNDVSDLPSHVRPGSRLAVFAEGAQIAAIDAPDLAIALDAARHALVGRAPPETSVAIEARAPDGSRIASGVVNTGSDGRFRSSLPDSVKALAGTVATATWPVDGPIMVRARWDAPHARIVLGQSQAQAIVPLGLVPAATVKRGRDVLAAVTGTLALGPPPAQAILAMVNPDAALVPILPGDTFALHLDGTIVASARAPRISARSEPLTDRVSGRIDAEGPIEISAGGARRTLTLSPAGAFEVSFAGAIDLLPETPVWVTTGGPVSFTSPAVAERLTVTLGSERIDGHAPPGWVVAATLRGEAAGGVPLGGATTTASQDGAFRMRLSDDAGDLAPANPRQRLIVAWEAAPSIEVSLPEITAEVDEASGTVRGRALPSAAVRVEARHGTARATVSVRADAEGAYTAAMGIALGPGASGRVIVRWDDRLAIARPWAIARIAVDAAAGQVAGAGAPGQEVHASAWRKGVRIGAADGVVGAPLAPWADELPCAPCDWSLVLHDGAYAAPLARGDVLRVVLDGVRQDVEVPGLEVAVNPWTDIASGRAVPGWPVVLRFERDGATSAAIALRADAFGAFRARVSDSWDAVGGDQAHLRVELGPYSFVARSDIGVLDVDLDHGTIEGVALPGALVSVGVYPGSAAPRGTGTASAAADGRYALTVRDEHGAAILPASGETVVVQFGTSVVAFELPELAFVLSDPADPTWVVDERIVGSASPGGTLRVRATRPTGDRGGRADGIAQRFADGRWALDLARRLDVAAGTRVEATWLTPDGRRARRAVRLPMLSAQVAGTRLSGYAAPAARVALVVTGAGRTPAGVEATADAEGVFEGIFSGAADDRLRPGDVVAAVWRDGDGPLGDGVAEMIVADLTANLEPATRIVRGHAPASTELALRAYGPGVTAGLPLLAARAGATGVYTVSIPGEGTLSAGAAAEAVVADAVGHRTTALTRQPRFTLVMREATIAGEVSPFAVVTASLDLPGATPEPRGARADTRGDVTLDLGQRAVRDGLVFRADVDGATSGFTVPPLGVAIDVAGKRVLGSAAAGASIAVRLEALGAPPSQIVITASDAGAWSLAEADLPAGMTVDRLRLVEARVELAEGHAIIARAVPPTPTPDPRATFTATPSPSATPGDPSATPAPDRTPSATPLGPRIYLPRASVTKP